MKIISCALGLMGYTAAAWAATPTINVKGFGSTGVVHSSQPGYYLSEFDTYGTELNYTQHTRLGVNLSSELSEKWTVATQFIAERGVNGFTSYLDWGFLSYQPMPELAIRVGRIIGPTWLFSQQLKVEYSFLWVRPPVEVYSLLSGFTNLNGLSLLSHVPFAGGGFSAELYGGQEDGVSYVNNPKLPTTTRIRINDMWGVDLNYSYQDIWQLHASYLQSHTNATVIAPEAAPVANIGGSYTYMDVVTPLDLHLGRFFSVGGKADYKNFILVTEFARRLITGQALQSASGWYATLGYRISRFTPYVNYAWQGSLRGAYNKHPDTSLTTMKTGQHSWLVGTDVQVHDSVILKGEWQKAKYEYADATKNFNADIFTATASFIF